VQVVAHILLSLLYLNTAIEFMQRPSPLYITVLPNAPYENKKAPELSGTLYSKLAFNTIKIL